MSDKNGDHKPITIEALRKKAKWVVHLWVTAQVLYVLGLLAVVAFVFWPIITLWPGLALTNAGLMLNSVRMMHHHDVLVKDIMLQLSHRQVMIQYLAEDAKEVGEADLN